MSAFRPAAGSANFASTATDFEQCVIATVGGPCGTYGLAGVVERPDGTVLLGSFGDCGDLLRTFTLSSTCPVSPAAPASMASTGFHCLSYGLDGRLYATRGFTTVIELNPATGAFIRQVAAVSATWYGVIGLTTDPRTGDLYGSAGSHVWRIANPAGPSPVMQLFAEVPTGGLGFDGCGFSCDGTFLLVAADDADRVYKFDRSGAASVLVDLPPGTGPDGICFGAPGTPLYGNAYTNNNNGSVTEIPLDHPEWARTIASGSGRRGDFLSVSTAGDLLVTQSQHLIRLRSTAEGRFDLPGSSLCGNAECAARADLNCVKNRGIRTSLRVAIPFICDPTNPPNARLARTCNSIDKIKKHSPECTGLLTAFRAMRDHLMTLAATPDCSGE